MGILELIVLVILAMLVLGALPTWPHSRNWGYYPSGGLVAVLLIVLLILLLRGSPMFVGPTIN
jgi:asparagine N-glycosylation enzyme membrane subunit Stt3